MSPRSRRLSASLAAAAAALFVVGCGDDGDSTSSASTGSTGSTASESDAAPTSSAPDGFPVTIEHKFGSTTIEEEPVRIVSVGYHEQDFLASLGNPPVMARTWMADIVNPWSQEAFGATEPESFEGTEIPYESIAAMDPDLIVGVYSWIDEEEYALLTDIAPTLAQSGDVGDGQMSWQDQLLWIGEAIGETELAQQQVDELDARFAAEREAHPEWEGLKLAVVAPGAEEYGAYASGDPRMRFFADLGFDTTALDDLVTEEGRFWITFSPERVDELADLDVVVWYNADPDMAALSNHLPFHDAGAEIWIADDNWPLFGFQTNLSIGASLDLLIPELELATDADPATVVPTAADAGIAP